jgi:hypothetical protein
MSDMVFISHYADKLPKPLPQSVRGLTKWALKRRAELGLRTIKGAGPTGNRHLVDKKKMDRYIKSLKT